MKYLFILSLLLGCQRSILTEMDFKLNGDEKISSTLVAKDKWKSAFFWNCYSSDQLKIEKFFSTGVGKYFPQIVIKQRDFIMNITLYSDIEVEADKTIRKWQSLVKDEPLVCMYMGNLPDKELYKEGIIFYYLEQIKTNKGSWKIPE